MQQGFNYRKFGRNLESVKFGIFSFSNSSQGKSCTTLYCNKILVFLNKVYFFDRKKFLFLPQWLNFRAHFCNENQVSHKNQIVPSSDMNWDAKNNDFNLL